ncbi:MAG: hypothetical protein V1737_03925, partial [Chloroflexota bacterium]
QNNRSLCFRLIIVCFAIMLFGTFWLSARSSSDPVSLTVMPQVPRENEPLLVTFKLDNPASQPLVTSFQLYANGDMIQEGVTTIAPASVETHKYAYQNTVKMGEQVSFTVKTRSGLGSFQKAVASPPYPPQTMSSFASFASFSTSVMTSMATMSYYQASFEDASNQKTLNVGTLITIALALLLVFMELSQPVIRGRSAASVGRLRIRFSTVTWILFIVFLGIVYTKATLILTM